MDGVTKATAENGTLVLHVTGNHKGVLKRVLEHDVTKILAQEYSLDDLFLAYYDTEDNAEGGEASA